MSSCKILEEYFSKIKDKRQTNKISHKLIDIIIITICAVICGADGWEDIEIFGKSKFKWLRLFLKLENGIPSADTFARVFSFIKPKEFEKCFLSWINSAVGTINKDIVSIDGKTLRRSFDKRENKSALHMVHAWAASNGVLLGQQKTEAKSNEITAIPKLLEIISIKGCIVTIDAMGCQKKIAEKIYSQGGDYLLATKGNQKELKEAMEITFKQALEKGFANMVYDKHAAVDAGHGRVEKRECYVLPEMYLCKLKIKWKGFKSLVLVKRTIIDKATSQEKTDSHYYLSSLEMNAEKILDTVRQHWSVENNLHWCLDVGFREDECRSRIGESTENFALLRRIALMLLKKDKTLKGGIQTKRLKAGWDKKYLLRVLLG